MDGTEKWPRSANIASAPADVNLLENRQFNNIFLSPIMRLSINDQTMLDLIIQIANKAITDNEELKDYLPVIHKTQPPRADQALVLFFLKKRYM